MHREPVHLHAVRQLREHEVSVGGHVRDRTGVVLGAGQGDLSQLAHVLDCLQGGEGFQRVVARKKGLKHGQIGQTLEGCQGIAAYVQMV